MSLRARFLAYLVVVHLLMAGVAWFVVAQNRLYLLAVEAVLALSFLTGLALTRRFFDSLEFVRQSAQLLEDSDFMSRVREVKQADVDRLIQVYNRMVDVLRGERVQLQEQQHFLSRVLHESPGGIVVLDFEGRVSLANPAAERLLQAPGDALTGARLAALDRALARDLVALGPGEHRVLAVWGGRRVRAQHGTFLDRGFRRSFFLLEELTEELRHSEKAAYEKLIRMLSHEVNNTVGASNSLLNSCLTYAVQLDSHDRVDFEQALGVVIARTEQLSAFMASFADVVRLPAPRLAPVDPASLVDGLLALIRAQADSRHIAVVRQGVGSLDGGATRPRPDRAGAAQRDEERARGDRPGRDTDGAGAASRRRPRDRGGGHRARPVGGSADAPVHAVLQHQRRRAGDRAHDGPGDSGGPRLPVRPRGPARGPHDLHGDAGISSGRRAGVKRHRFRCRSRSARKPMRLTPLRSSSARIEASLVNSSNSAARSFHELVIACISSPASAA